MIPLTEVYKTQQPGSDEKTYSLRQVMISPQLVSLIREDDKIEDCFKRGLLPKNLDKRQKFSKIHLTSLNNSSLTVVGDMFLICKKLLGG
mgnify:CR=1 FL=1